MKEFIDETTEKEGTPFNRKNMMAIQGFDAKTIEFKNDGSIVETNSDGETLTTTFDADGSITEVFVGQKTITKKTIFSSSGGITTEVLS